MFDPCYGKPAAIAQIRGGSKFPGINGCVFFYPRQEGVLIVADIRGLPHSDHEGIFGFHIHEGNNCMGESFVDTGGHYNPTNNRHPYHAGDLPPLFSFSGRAYMSIWTDRFRTRDVIGRTVVIHENADDLHSQPSGQSGEKIACGIIRRCCCL